MREILAPGFELFRCDADLFAERAERLPETMGVEVRQFNSLEGLAENPPDRRGTTPAHAFQATWFEQPGCPNRDPEWTEKGVRSARTTALSSKRRSSRQRSSRYPFRLGRISTQRSCGSWCGHLLRHERQFAGQDRHAVSALMRWRHLGRRSRWEGKHRTVVIRRGKMTPRSRGKV